MSLFQVLPRCYVGRSHTGNARTTRLGNETSPSHYTSIGRAKSGNLGQKLTSSREDQIAREGGVCVSVCAITTDFNYRSVVRVPFRTDDSEGRVPNYSVGRLTSAKFVSHQSSSHTHIHTYRRSRKKECAVCSDFNQGEEARARISRAAHLHNTR